MVLCCLQILFPHSSLSMAHAKNRISRLCKMNRAHSKTRSMDVDLPRHMHDPSILAPLVSRTAGSQGCGSHAHRHWLYFPWWQPSPSPLPPCHPECDCPRKNTGEGTWAGKPSSHVLLNSKKYACAMIGSEVSSVKDRQSTPHSPRVFNQLSPGMNPADSERGYFGHAVICQ